MESNKVKIEITSGGWETKVIIDGVEYAEKYEGTQYGATSISGDFENELSIPTDLYHAICGLNQYEVLKRLGELNQNK